MKAVQVMAFLAVAGLFLFVPGIILSGMPASVWNLIMLMGLVLLVQGSSYVKAYEIEKKRMKDKLLKIMDEATDMNIVKQRIKEEM